MDNLRALIYTYGQACYAHDCDEIILETRVKIMAEIDKMQAYIDELHQRLENTTPEKAR